MDAIIEDKKSLLQRFILWREQRIKEKHFILILSFLVGIFTALAAWFLKFLVEWIKEFLTENFDSTGVNWLYLVYPVVGIFLTGLFIRHIVKDDISHGVTKILYAISRRQSRIKRHNTWSCGLVSLYFTRAMNSVENVFRRYNNPYVKLTIGGIMLSVLIFLFPPLYGEGYDTINLLLNGVSNQDWDTVMNNSIFYGYGGLLLVYLALIVLFKVFASSATNGGGGCGGIFAPSLFLGCITGFIFAHFCNEFHLGPYIPEKNFALLGMAGLMSGVMHAPLTGIFLIAELTGGYDLFLPLMMVSVSSYLTIMVFEPHSIYSMRLAKKGELLTHHKDKAVLTLMNIESVVETDFEKVRPDMDLGEMVKVISQAKRNLFPVVDVNGELLGIVALDDIRNIMFRQELYHRFKVEKFMVSPAARIYVNDSMEEVMRKFDDTKAWNLPVIDELGKYKGFVSKSKIFNSYRQVLVDFSAD